MAVKLIIICSWLVCLQAELLPPPPAVNDPNFVITDPAYRQSVGTALFYKFFLEALVDVYGPGAVAPNVLSATVYRAFGPLLIYNNITIIYIFICPSLYTTFPVIMG